jgi:hypothetical protein
MMENISAALRLERANFLEFADEETDELSCFFFVSILPIWRIYFQQKNAVAEEIQRGGSNLEALQRISSSMDAGLTLMIVLTVFALCWNVLQILYIRHLILRPVKLISASSTKFRAWRRRLLAQSADHYAR